jgi:hypothetical protein
MVDPDSFEEKLAEIVTAAETFYGKRCYYYEEGSKGTTEEESAQNLQDAKNAKNRLESLQKEFIRQFKR